MRAHGVEADAVEIAHGFRQPRGSCHVLRARFEAPRRSVERGRALEHRLHHAPASQQGRRFLEEAPLAVQHADAHRAVQLVARERGEVDVEVVHVEGLVRDALRAVEHGDGAAGVRRFDDALDGRHGSQHVRHAGERHHAGARADCPVDLVV